MRQVVEGWVWSRNVRPLLELLSRYAGYAFDDTDWETVEAALPATDDERDDGWYSYPLVGPDQAVRVRLATAVGSDVVCVEISGVQTAELRIRADTLLSAFATA
ncbi:hypothetical protein L7D48_25980 [Streptomyces sp. S1A]|uniref:hypothetical protein n=1 Tax=Streptomyces sp. ICN903 TaxID=2964654 RepID=UPI001EDB3416|nr:hypothetical protein [Streptomyces sp. ICN903]MCG3043984.1 hypothetical protein [Streptomyces sp. ICN903]